MNNTKKKGWNVPSNIQVSEFSIKKAFRLWEEPTKDENNFAAIKTKSVLMARLLGIEVSENVFKKEEQKTLRNCEFWRHLTHQTRVRLNNAVIRMLVAREKLITGGVLKNSARQDLEGLKVVRITGQEIYLLRNGKESAYPGSITFLFPDQMIFLPGDDPEGTEFWVKWASHYKIPSEEV